MNLGTRQASGFNVALCRGGMRPLQEQAAGPRHLLPKMFLEMLLL